MTLGRFVSWTVALLLAGCGPGYAPQDASGPRSNSTASAPIAAAGLPGNGNADCAHFCNQLPPGPERGECVSAATKAQGLCAACNANLGLLCADAAGQRFCCSSGQTCCGVACADLQSDALNCGVCGNVCPSGFCASGACCAPGTNAVCNGKCVNTLTDVANCGACGNACGAGASCIGGTCCTPTTCAAAGRNCGTISNGCGGTLDCGTCSPPQSCGGGGIPNVCGCTPTSCGAVGAHCGRINNGCGGTIDCGGCGFLQQCCSNHQCAFICF